MRPVLLALTTLILGGCGTRTGNGFVVLELGGYGAVQPLGFLAPAGPPEAVLCLRRLRFVEADTGDEVSVDFNVGEVTVRPNGGSLGNVGLPPGTYRGIEFDLHDKCASGRSVRARVGAKTYSTGEDVTLRFRGTFTHTDQDTKLSLSIGAIMRALRAVEDDGDIRGALESAEGSF